MSTRELIAGSLQEARYALEQNACYGQTFTINLRHSQRPSGCATRLRIAVDPHQVVCRAFNVGKNHRLFSEAVKPLFAFTDGEMQGWTSQSNSCGTGEGKVFWAERSYQPRKLNPVNINFAELLQAVASAREACNSGSQFRLARADRWQSSRMDNGIYPVAWVVRAKGSIITVQLKNKGSSSDAFTDLTRWVFDYIKLHNSEGQGQSQWRGIVFKIFSDTLRLEAPSRPTF